MISVPRQRHFSGLGHPEWETVPSFYVKRERNQMKKILLLVVVLFVGGCSYLAVKTGLSSPDRAGAGDCVKQAGSQSIELVDCTDPAADYRVLGRVDNQTRIQAQINSLSICKKFPEAQSSYWKGEEGKPGYVLCLAPAR